MQKPQLDSDIQDDTDAVSRIVQRLEPKHFGEYVMIDPQSGSFVIAATVSEVHAKFIEAFGPDRLGQCRRVGASPFAAA
jgi:hypothetical protein